MRIAAYQFNVTGDIEKNLGEIQNAVIEAKRRGADFILFPECALTGYPPRNIPSAECVDFGAVEIACAKIQSTVDELKIRALVGTAFRENGRIYNRAILFRPDSKPAHYDKRALWGWDGDNFTVGSSSGVFELDGLKIGVRICFEVRFPEYFREPYTAGTDLNFVAFYDVSDTDDTERYALIKAHLQTRAAENVVPIVSVNAVSPFQTAPTAVFGKSGQIIAECERNVSGMLLFDFEKTPDNFGEQGRRVISNGFIKGEKI